MKGCFGVRQKTLEVQIVVEIGRVARENNIGARL